MFFNYYLDVYTNIFMYFRIIKPWNHPMKLRLTNMNMYCIYNVAICVVHVYVCRDGHYLVCTVWTCILCMWNTYTCDQIGCLACVPVPLIHVYEHTTADPLCYINLTFVKIPFAKLYYVKLLGTFVGLAFCIQARFSHVKSKNKQMTTWPFQWYYT